jgi:hypothetical protein
MTEMLPIFIEWGEACSRFHEIHTERRSPNADGSVTFIEQNKRLNAKELSVDPKALVWQRRCTFNHRYVS